MKEKLPHTDKNPKIIKKHKRLARSNMLLALFKYIGVQIGFFICLWVCQVMINMWNICGKITLIRFQNLKGNFSKKQWKPNMAQEEINADKPNTISLWIH